MRLAAVIIATEKRRALLSEVVASIEGCDERIVVGEWPRWPELGAMPRITYLGVAPITRTTIDALVKRDVGFIASTADAVLYLSDDHRLDPAFLETFRARYADGETWDVLVPARYTERDGQTMWLNNGSDDGYAGGHCAIYRRACTQFLPWAATAHHPNWDVLSSRQLQLQGFRFLFAEPDLAVEDIEWRINPESKPWL